MPLRDWINKLTGRPSPETSAQELDKMMALMPELERRITAGDKKTLSLVQNLPGVPIHKFTDYTSYLLAGCSKCWAAYKSADIIGSVLVSTAFKVVQDGKKTPPKVDPNLARLLKWPNPRNSWEDMIYQWTFHMLFTGNAYWLKDMRNGYGQPTFLYPLLPQFMSPIPDAQSGVSGYRYRINNHDVVFEPDEILHFSRPHPMNPFVGLGNIEAAEGLLNNFINQDSYDQRFMENGAQPSGIMVLGQDTMDDQTTLDRLKKKWNDEYGGVKNAGKVAWLNGKWTYEQLGMTHRNMQKIETEQQNLENIFMLFGVPLSIVGIEAAANFATAQIDQQNFRNFTCVPLLDNLVGKLNGPPSGYENLYGESGLIQNYNPNYRLDYDHPVDVQTTVTQYLPLVNSGVMTRNELRDMVGLPKVNNAYLDDFFISNLMEPIEAAGLATPTDAQVDALTDPARANDGTQPAKPEDGATNPDKLTDKPPVPPKK